MNEVISFIGTPDAFISDFRQKVAASPKDDLLRIGLAVWLYIGGEFAEATRQAALVAQDGSVEQNEPTTSSREGARTQILDALTRATSIYELTYLQEYPDDAKMRFAALEQYSQLIEIFEQHMSSPAE